MPGVALQDIHAILAQDTARVRTESTNATESLLRVFDDPPPPGSKPPLQPQQHPQHPHAPHHQHPHPHFMPPHSNNNSNNNMSSPASPNGTPAKHRLSTDQKRYNHIQSEKKRREAIRDGFDKLACIVPGMTGMGRSEAVVLQHTVAFMKYQIEKREALDRIAEEGLSAKERNDIYVTAEQKIRKQDEDREKAAQHAHQVAQQAARNQQMPQR